MTKAERKVLIDYIRLLADQMRLRDWTLNLADEPAEDGFSATIRLVYGRKLARIFIDKEIRSVEPEDLRHTIVHELIHVHFEPAANAVLNDLQSLVGRPADTVFWEGFKRQYEYGTDGLADAVAGFFPLIDWSAS